MADTVFFLGANSGRGFYSLYGSFPEGGEFLHIIKGGPGTGKSGYMKAMYKKAHSLSMDTERILCSGDPDSLDGLVIPQMSRAWADGTAPHVLEPECYGVSGNYVNIGRFCAAPLNERDSASACELTREYRRYYDKAFVWLKLAEKHTAEQKYDDKAAELENNIDIINQSVRDAEKGKGSLTRRFISAESCLGHIVLNCTLETLCKQYYVINCPDNLRTLSDYALALGCDVIACPRPRQPETLEAVLLPVPGLAFVSAELLSGEKLSDFSDCGIITRPQYGSEAEAEFMELAWDSLRRAKLVHDELEKVYLQYMNFAALNDFTKTNIGQLFG